MIYWTKSFLTWHPVSLHLEHCSLGKVQKPRERVLKLKLFKNRSGSSVSTLRCSSAIHPWCSSCRENFNSSLYEAISWLLLLLVHFFNVRSYLTVRSSKECYRSFLINYSSLDGTATNTREATLQDRQAKQWPSNAKDAGAGPATPPNDHGDGRTQTTIPGNTFRFLWQSATHSSDYSRLAL